MKTLIWSFILKTYVPLKNGPRDFQNGSPFKLNHWMTESLAFINLTLKFFSKNNLKTTTGVQFFS